MAVVSWSLWLQQAVLQQVALVQMLWRDSRFWGPMVALWMADFGSSVSDPVGTYLYLALGMTAEQIGYLGFASRFLTIFFSPIYGSSVDKFGIFWPLFFSIACCGTGCTLKGTVGSLPGMLVAMSFMGIGGQCTWTMVKGYVAPKIEDSSRALLIAGLQMQMMVLSCTSVIYPLFDGLIRWVLKTENLLLRYRAAICFCGAACWISILVLVYWAARERKRQRASVIQPSAEYVMPGPTQVCSDVEDDAPSKTQHSFVKFSIAAAALCAVVWCQTMLTMLWPIYIKFHYGWNARSFAYLSFAQTLALAIGLTVYPKAIEGKVNQQQFVKILVVAAACTLPGFLVKSSSLQKTTLALHLISSVACLALVGLMASGTETLASLCMAGNVQGCALGTLQTMKAVGALGGFFFGPRMWTWSLARAKESQCSVDRVVECMLGGGNLPFCAAFLLLALVLALFSFGDLAPDASQGLRTSSVATKNGKVSQESSGPSAAVVGLQQQRLNPSAAGNAAALQALSGTLAEPLEAQRI